MLFMNATAFLASFELLSKETGYGPDLTSINNERKSVESLEVQNGLAKLWKAIDSTAKVTVSATIEEAIASARNFVSGGEALVFVTGSLDLVGGVIEVLESGA